MLNRYDRLCLKDTVDNFWEIGVGFLCAAMYCSKKTGSFHGTKMIKISGRQLRFAFLAISFAMPMSASAQANQSLFGVDSGSVTYGPYVRLDYGQARPQLDDGQWHSPGPADPVILFDVNSENATFASVGVGFDWLNGFKGDLSYSKFGSVDVEGIHTTAGDHADMTTTASTTALMATAYYSPLEQQGNNSRVQPYLSAGVGVARNTMDDWTRTNLTKTRKQRTFEGATTSSAAWSVGLGVAMELKRDRGKTPMIVEMGYRYFDLGTMQGGSAPLPSNGNSTPQIPFEYSNRQQVVTVGIRIPLKKY